jgi:hypothetical protein
MSSRRGSQVVRPRSAKPLFIGSTPIRASNTLFLIPATLLTQKFSKSRLQMGASATSQKPNGTFCLEANMQRSLLTKTVLEGPTQTPRQQQPSLLKFD